MNAQKKSTHTPGPWSRNIRAGGKYPTVFAGRNQHVAHVVQQADPAETEANIDLIAAAPELLAAAIRVLEKRFIPGVSESSDLGRLATAATKAGANWTPSQSPCALAIASAAIAKAGAA